MRNNIISILIFFGFITSVFIIGYAISGDETPLVGSELPQISTNGGRSISRSTDNGLALGTMSANQRSSSGSHTSASWGTVQSPSSGGQGGLTTTSSAVQHSIGGGQQSSATGGSNSSSTSANTMAMGHFGTGGMPITFRHKGQGLAEVASEPQSLYDPIGDSQSLKLGFGDEGNTDDDDKKPEPWEDPYKTPIGDTPWIMIIMLCCMGIARSKQRIRRE